VTFLGGLPENKYGTIGSDRYMSQEADLHIMWSRPTTEPQLAVALLKNWQPSSFPRNRSEGQLQWLMPESQILGRQRSGTL
jgi:hypothetical protein